MHFVLLVHNSLLYKYNSKLMWNQGNNLVPLGAHHDFQVGGAWKLGLGIFFFTALGGNFFIYPCAESNFNSPMSI